MYEDFFGLTDQPFRLTTDPTYLYLSASHARARAYLKYALCRRDGIVTITGDIGTGKSTLVSSVRAEADADTDMVVLHQTQLDAVELLQAMLFGMGLTLIPTTKAELLDNARAALIDRHRRGRNVTLIVDDAHNLSASVLEELRMLADIEDDGNAVLSLVLVGQPGLRTTLAQRGLEQLRQRIRLNYRLEPLTAASTARYVRHRLRVAGSGTLLIFPPECESLIYRFSRGVPRRINLLCDMALTAASLGQRRSVSPQCVIDAARELGWETDSLAWRTQRHWQSLRASPLAARLTGRSAKKTQPRAPSQWPAEQGSAALRDRAAAAAARLRALSHAAAEHVGKLAVRMRDATRSAALGAAAATALGWRALSARWPRKRPVALAASALPVLLMPLAVLCIAALAPADRREADAAVATRTVPGDVSADTAPAIVVPAAYRAAADGSGAMGPPTHLAAASAATNAQAPEPSATPAPASDQARAPATAAAANTDLESDALRPFTWILNQQPDAYTIQILGTHRPRNLERFVARHAADLELAYFTTARNNRDWFVLVAGRYPTFSAAREASLQLPDAIRRNGPWVRSFAELQTAIGGAPREDRAARLDATGFDSGG